MRLLGNVFMLAAALALFAYPFVFHVTSGGLWRYSVAGRALMTFMGVLGGVMIFAVAQLAFHPLPFWVRPAVWLVIAAAAWWQIRTLFVVRRRGNAVSD